MRPTRCEGEEEFTHNKSLLGDVVDEIDVCKREDKSEAQLDGEGIDRASYT